MRCHVRGIDHVVVLARDLDKAQHANARMGFTLTPRGFHTLGSQNLCLMFGSDYVELLAVPKPHPAMQHYTDFLAKGEGLGAIALATDDTRGLHASFAADGIVAGGPLDFPRPLEGLGDARFRIVQLPPDASPGCSTFACQHFTRELVGRSTSVTRTARRKSPRWRMAPLPGALMTRTVWPWRSVSRSSSARAQRPTRSR